MSVPINSTWRSERRAGPEPGVCTGVQNVHKEGKNQYGPVQTNAEQYRPEQISIDQYRPV